MTARQSESSIAARALAHQKWAKCQDPSAATAAARASFARRFLDEADPTGELRLKIAAPVTTSVERTRLEKELARRAEHAKKAYYTRLALASAQARRARK